MSHASTTTATPATTTYGLHCDTDDKDFGSAVARVTEALKTEGFGVLTEIDVAATLKTKLDIDRPPLRILGACNPALAHRALEIESSVSLLLPCNVVVEPTHDGRTRVSVIDPVQLFDDERLAALADEATDRLQKALDALGPGEPR